jgi:tRNA(fMet)-specific endonuclease VapC
VGTVIDSSVVIAAERGQLNLEELLSRRSEADPMVLSAVTASELLHGLQRTKTAAQRRRRESFVEAVLNTLTIVPFDLTVARVHASIWAQSAARGLSVGERDLMIAATAISLQYRVATRDRGFARISGLTVEIW